MSQDLAQLSFLGQGEIIDVFWCLSLDSSRRALIAYVPFSVERLTIAKRLRLFKTNLNNTLLNRANHQEHLDHRGSNSLFDGFWIYEAADALGHIFPFFIHIRIIKK